MRESLHFFAKVIIKSNTIVSYVKEIIFQPSQVLYHLCLTFNVLVFIPDAICKV